LAEEEAAEAEAAAIAAAVAAAVAARDATSDRARAEAAAAALVRAGLMTPSQAAAATDAAVAAEAAAEEKVLAAGEGEPTETTAAAAARYAGLWPRNGAPAHGSSKPGCATAACLWVGGQPPLLIAADATPEERQLVARNAEAEQQKVLELNFRQELAAQEDAVPGCCLLCFDREPDSIFLGCGHGGVCYQCAVDTFVAHHEVRPDDQPHVQRHPGILTPGALLLLLAPRAIE
jgi:hypothetical protein